MITPRRLRQLPNAVEPRDDDVFPVSQYDPDLNISTTRGMRRDMFLDQIIDEVNDARQDLVDGFTAANAQINQTIADLQAQQEWSAEAIDQIEAIDTALQTAVADLENKVEHPAQWDEIANKPPTFPPTLPISYANVSDKPTSFAPAPHTHPQSDVTNLVADLGNKAPISHVGDNNNPHMVTKAQVGLGNADNTSDVNKPVSTAQTAAFAPIAHVSATNNPHATTKAQVGLGNVDNTSDANKPISTATQTALNGKIDGPILIGNPNTLTPAFGTAYQATNPTKPSFISAMIDTAYTVTVASTLADTVELRIGSNQTQVANGTGGFVAATFRASLTGIALVIGLGMGQRNQLTALLPAGWFWSLRRTQGASATITSASDQAIG